MPAIAGGASWLIRRHASFLASSRHAWEHLVRHDPAQRVFELIARTAEFEAFFPAISVRTDMIAARRQEAVQQLGLFG